MAFTGRLGTQNSRLGNIVLGIVDSFGLGTFGFVVHQTGARQIRVLFDVPVIESAIVDGSFVLSSTAPPFTSIVPAILSIEFFDETRTSVVLNLSLSLTTSVTYSLQAFGIEDADGETVSSAARNFVANVRDPPHVLGAYLSRRGCVDVVFDRPVGPFSPEVTALVFDPAGGPAASMILLPWDSELVLPDTAIRMAFPVVMPVGNQLSLDISDVFDESHNTFFGVTEIELALRSPLPYDYSKITQLQITDAYVADVSNDLIKTGTVRVFFNCPVGNATDQINWDCTQDGPHVRTDSINAITAPPASDLGTLIALMNDFKAKYNAHAVTAGVHLKNDLSDLVTSPNASDLQTATDLLNEAQQKLLSHFTATGVHEYDDIFNTFTSIIVPPFSLGFAISVANGNLIPAYEGHIAAEYPLVFSAQFPPEIGTIADLSHMSISSPGAPKTFPAVSPYTYFADLHFVMNSYRPNVNIKATLTSDEGGSVTNPADYTGSIVARSGGSPAIFVSDSERVDVSISATFDREVVLDSSSSVEFLQDGGIPLPGSGASATASMPGLFWALNQLVFAYATHIQASPSVGAGHQNTDITNIPSYATEPTLESMIAAANSLTDALNAHMSSEFYHYQQDGDLVRPPVASDEDTLIAVVDRIRSKFLAHNFRLGVHASPGWRIFSARLYDTVRVSSPSMKDGAEYVLSASFRSSYHDNSSGELVTGTFDGRRFGKDFFAGESFQIPISGSAYKPSIASALPRTGIVSTPDGPRLGTDVIEVFFSKPMRRVPLDSTKLVLTGGTITFVEADWEGSKSAVIEVSNMTSTTYSLQAVGLTDEAGNPVYP